MTTFTWTGGNDVWSNAGDWSNTTGGTPPPGAGDVAYLNSVDYGPFTITVTGDVTVSSLNWNTESPTVGATIDISSGTLDVTGPGTVLNGTAAGATIELSSAGTGSLLQIGNGGAALSNTDVETSVLFANDGSSSAVVYWDSAPGSTLQTGNDQISLDNFFGSQDTLEIAGSGSLQGAAAVNSGTLSFNVGGTDYSVLLSGTYLDNFQVTSNSGTITVTNPCFLRGTRIATLRGEVAVEDLRIGDLVVTTAGTQPVKWIGTRGFVTRLLHAHNRAAALPVRIAAGALDEAIPARDLLVSPDHMLCLDDVLIPAGKLVNGITITRAEDVEVVQYFHIELPRHAVLTAEGALAESFLDTGNRNQFANVLSYAALGHDPEAPRQQPCLPVVTGGKALAAAHARLAERAIRMATTEDDDLHLLVDGTQLRPTQTEGTTLRFTVPARAAEVRIVSRSVVPAELDQASGDTRRLGICLAGLSLRDGSVTLDLAPGHAGLADGFQAAEDGRRWTDGNALLPIDLLATMPGEFVLELKLIRTGLRYPAPARTDATVRRAAVRGVERLSA